MDDSENNTETDDQAPTIPLLVTCFVETLVNLSRILLVQVIVVRDFYPLSAVADSRIEDTRLAWTVSNVYRTDVDGGGLRIHEA